MSATDAVARMLTLVPWLLERPGASLAETADAFGVPERVIRADLEHLDFCGLPGLGGGDLFDVTLVEDRVVVTMADELRRPLRPTPGEALRLVLTAGAAAEVLGEEVPALRSAVDKVRSALGVPDGTVAVVAPVPPSAVADRVRGALDGQHRLRLLYQGRADTQPRRRDVDPWSLHLVDGAWYLQGHDDDAQDARSFRLDRIVEVELLQEPVRVPAPDTVPAPRYVPGKDDVRVVLDVSPAAGWLLDAVEPDEVTAQGDGRYRVVFRTDAVPWVIRLLLMSAGAARIVEPDDVAALAVAAARAALGRYGVAED